MHRRAPGQCEDRRQFVRRHGPQAVRRDADIGTGQGADRRPRSVKQLCELIDRADEPALAGMLDFHAQGIPTLDYGNNIRQMAKDMGLKNAFDFPGFVPAYIRPLFCRGVGPFRWAALSGDPEDIFRTDAKVKELMPDDKHLHNWLDMPHLACKLRNG